jgi:hypothetical protein
VTRVVRSRYRYKRPPKHEKAVPLEVPAVLTISKKTRRRLASAAQQSHEAPPEPTKNRSHDVTDLPANNDRKPAIVSSKQPLAATTAFPSAIVTARKPGKRYAEVPEVSEEEHRRVGDLADAMMQEFKRVIAEKVRQ